MNNRKKITIIFSIFTIIYLIFIIFLTWFVYVYSNNEIKLVGFNFKDNKLTVNLEEQKNRRSKELFCYFSTNDKIPNINDKNWKKAVNNKCEIEYSYNSYNLWIKDKEKILFKYDFSNYETLEFNVDAKKTTIYLAKGDKYIVNYVFKTLGINKDALVWKTTDDKVVEIKDGVIYGKANGKATVTISNKDKSFELLFHVTDLIIPRPKLFNTKKPYLTCGRYTKEENDLLDTILEDRVNDVGYKTRAGVVEAARFIALELPYRINYFLENGRDAYYTPQRKKVQGEGRYYFKGLYLDESRYKNIKYSYRGPKTWGCNLYSPNVRGGGYDENGLDCSGFVSWVLLNGGFDYGDLSAGITDYRRDLTYAGKRVKLTKEIANDNKSIKAGDLLHSYRVGGHIAIVAGLDENHYYVAEAIWYDEFSVTIKRYTKDQLVKLFDNLIMMDSYYKEDGKYTKMWY